MVAGGADGGLEPEDHMGAASNPVGIREPDS